MTDNGLKDRPEARVELVREADFVLGSARVSPATREVVFGRARHVLQPRVMQVLVALARRKGEVVSRDQLVTSCWGGLSVSEDAIQRSIAALRRLAGQCGDPQFSIETVARVGYRLLELRPPGSSPGRVAVTEEEALALVTASPVTSIAVLPFVNMSSDPEQEYFSDGLSEELLNQLTQVGALRVAARTSCFAFKGMAIDVKQIGEKLGVKHLLEGSVRKAGNRLRVTAQLVTCADGYHLWSHSYDCELDNVFAVQESIARAVAEALSVQLGIGAMASVAGGTTHLQAYDKYLRGRALFVKGEGADLVGSAQLYREALSLDPAFALARASLAWTYSRILIFAPENREQTIRALDYTALDALTHAPHQSASHLANGVLQIVRHDWRAAEAAFRKAVALAPPHESSAAILSTFFSVGVGRSAEAVQVLERARTADPLSTELSQWLQQVLDIAGRSSDAQLEYERSQGLAGISRDIREHQRLQRIWDSGDPARIKAQWQRFLDQQATSLPILREVLTVFDQPVVAASRIRRAIEDPANQDPSRMLILAWYAAHYGDIEFALKALRRGLVEMEGGVFVGSIWYPVLKGVRRTPGFKDLVRDLGLVDYWRATGSWGDFARPVGSEDFECW